MSTKTKIFDAAIETFAEKGYDITTVEDILKKAEVSRRTFYKYYRSKKEILLQLKEENIYEDSFIKSAINKLFPNFDNMSSLAKFEIIFEIRDYIIDQDKFSIVYQGLSKPEMCKEVNLDILSVQNKSLELYKSIYQELGFENPTKMAKITSVFFEGYYIKKHLENVFNIDFKLDTTLSDFKNLIISLNPEAFKK